MYGLRMIQRRIRGAIRIAVNFSKEKSKDSPIAIEKRIPIIARGLNPGNLICGILCSFIFILKIGI